MMKVLPSVTQAIGPWVDFSQVPPDVLEAAADKGRRVHQICAAKLKKLWVPVPDECAPYIKSFEGWLPRIKEIIVVEEPLVDTVYGFRGRVDLICRLEGDTGRCLVDFKTPRTTSRSWRIQLAAYSHLAIPKYGPLRVIALRLSPEGRVAKVTEYGSTQARDFAIFLACLTAFKYFNGEGI